MTRKFFVYTKPDCPHCVRAKALLDSLGVPYLTQSLETAEQRQAVLAKLNGHSTWPAILEIDSVTNKPIRLVGGGDALEQLLGGA